MSRRIALIVGVSQYESRTGLHNLSAPVNDAQRVYDVLSEYGDFDMLYPLPLADGEVGSSGKVYAHDLQAKLCEVLSPSADEEVDLAVFYFSGHGVSERGQVVYLSTSDERLAIAIPWLAELVKTSAVKNVCIWLDCCHSGEVLKFTDLGERGFCVVAASHAEGEALARADGNSLLTDILCKALTPSTDCQEIQVKHFINELEQQRHNLPQQVLCRWSDTPFTLTQLNGEVARESSSLHKPARGWVWHSTDESIAAGQISVLSVLETFFALGLYGWLAFHFEHQWWLLISAVAAPIILLRSPESKALGVKWLGNYWRNRGNSVDWNCLSPTDKVLHSHIPFFIITMILTWWLFNVWLSTEDWILHLHTILPLIGTISLLVILYGMAVMIFVKISESNVVLIVLIVITMIIAIAILPFMLVMAIASLPAILVAFIISLMVAAITVFSDSKKRSTQLPATIILIILFMPFFAFSIWMRSLLVRIFATIRHPITGLYYLPENWHQTLGVIDFVHQPELLPGSAKISNELTVRGLIYNMPTEKNKHWWGNIILILFWYPPAVMWRWSLKATLWLWFPLALLLRSPFEGKSLGEVRDILNSRDIPPKPSMTLGSSLTELLF